MICVIWKIGVMDHRTSDQNLFNVTDEDELPVVHVQLVGVLHEVIGTECKLLSRLVMHSGATSDHSSSAQGLPPEW